MAATCVVVVWRSARETFYLTKLIERNRRWRAAGEWLLRALLLLSGDPPKIQFTSLNSSRGIGGGTPHVNAACVVVVIVTVLKMITLMGMIMMMSMMMIVFGLF